MTGLIDSLLEVGSDRKTVFLVEGDLEEVVRQAAAVVCSLPQHREREIEVVTQGSTWGWFDTRRLERAFFNLLLNACEAAPEGRVGVQISAADGLFHCRVWDTGSGIPQAIRATVFEPFVSAGKNNGTGLGLAIVNKTILDHDGSICVERTSSAGTTFLIRIPRTEVRGQTPMAEVAA
jgi:signal transduction histidine kinase